MGYFLISTAPEVVIPVAMPYNPGAAPAYDSNYTGGASAPYNPNANYTQPSTAQYGQQQQQPLQMPWTPWEGFQSRKYQPPPLQLQNVNQEELNKRHITPSGRFRALLIGINYKGTSAALKGCANDA